MASVAERLAAAHRELEAAGFPPADAALDAEVLARHLLHWDRATLLTRGRDPEPDGFSASLAGYIRRRCAREPVSQIIGQREFWGLDFEVTRDVLTPRPETELIVEEAVAFAASHPCRHVIDVGTGSGCIAIAIARELPKVQVTAVDVSAEALAVARRNARRHAVEDCITFVNGDLFTGVRAAADVIVSNPPYVPDDVPLPPEVVQYEPHGALFGGPDGFATISRLFTESAAHLAPGGQLVVEFGFGQPEIRGLATAAGWTVVRIREDLQGIPRTIVLTRASL